MGYLISESPRGHVLLQIAKKILKKCAFRAMKILKKCVILIIIILKKCISDDIQKEILEENRCILKEKYTMNY